MYKADPTNTLFPVTRPEILKAILQYYCDDAILNIANFWKYSVIAKAIILPILLLSLSSYIILVLTEDIKICCKFVMQ